MNKGVYPDTQIALPIQWIYTHIYFLYTIIYMCFFYFIIIFNVGMWNIYSIYKGLRHPRLLKNAE